MKEKQPQSSAANSQWKMFAKAKLQKWNSNILVEKKVIEPSQTTIHNSNMLDQNNLISIKSPTSLDSSLSKAKSPKMEDTNTLIVSHNPILYLLSSIKYHLM